MSKQLGLLALFTINTMNTSYLHICFVRPAFICLRCRLPGISVSPFFFAQCFFLCRAACLLIEATLFALVREGRKEPVCIHGTIERLESVGMYNTTVSCSCSSSRVLYFEGIGSGLFASPVVDGKTVVVVVVDTAVVVVPFFPETGGVCYFFGNIPSSRVLNLLYTS